MKSSLFILLDTEASNLKFLANQSSYSFVIHSWLILWHHGSAVSDVELSKAIETEMQNIKGVNLTEHF